MPNKTLACFSTFRHNNFLILAIPLIAMTNYNSLRQYILTTFILALCGVVTAQNAESQTGFLAFGATYGFDMPGGDLSDRYGSNFHAAMSFDIWNPKLKGFWGVEGELHFGDNVKEDVLATVKTLEGAVLGTDGGVSEIFLRRRGSYLGIHANRNILSFGSEKATGLNVGLGLGIMQHNIRIQDDTNNAGQFKNDYLKGYDRNTRGPALRQSIGIQSVGSSNTNINYAIALTITEGFTRDVRSVNFDTGIVNDGSRLDLLIALEATWYLPLIRFSGSKEIFY